METTAIAWLLEITGGGEEGERERIHRRTRSKEQDEDTYENMGVSD